MSSFTYEVVARDRGTGRLQRSTRVSSSAGDLTDELVAEDRLPVAVTPTTTSSSQRLRYRGNKVVFYRELATLLTEFVSTDARNASIKELFPPTSDGFFGRLGDLVTYPLAWIDNQRRWHETMVTFSRKYVNAHAWQVMETLPATFAEFEVALMRVALGTDEAAMLERLATFYEQVEAVWQRITRQLWLPALYALLLGFAFIYFILVLFPQVADISKMSGTQLPPTIAFLINAANSAKNPIAWVEGIVGIGAAIFGIRAIVKRPQLSGKIGYVADRILLNAGTFGKLVLAQRLAQVYYILHLLSAAGRQVDALQAAYAAAPGPVFRDALRRAYTSQQQRAKTTWHEYLDEAAEIFPSAHRRRIANGFITGKRVDVLNRLGDEMTSKAAVIAEQIPQKISAATAFLFGALIGVFILVVITPLQGWIANL